MGRGTLRRRGKASWELKFDLGTDSATGKRRTRYVTVKGRRQDAQKELTRLLSQSDAGTLVESSKVTVAEYMRAWLGPPPKPDELPTPRADKLSPKTLERYRELSELYVYPHLGAIVMQKLRPDKVRTWHKTLLESGGRRAARWGVAAWATPTGFCTGRWSVPSRRKRSPATLPQ